jgi:folate-binding protein YgfZ
MLEAMAATDTAPLASQYAALTEACGLVDRSERGKLALSGSGTVEFLNGQVTNELLDLAPGAGCYAAFLTHKGKMLGDLRILVASGDERTGGAPLDARDGGPSGEQTPWLLLDTERVALQALFDMIRRFKVGYEVELHKRTLESSLLSLIGPTAPHVAAKAFALSLGELPEREDDHLLVSLSAASRALTAPFQPPADTAPSVPVVAPTHARLVRTDVGIDLLFDTPALAVVSAMLEGAGAMRVSEDAAEVVRVEHGRPRYGIDLDENAIPQEAGLNERAVSFTKGCYVGQETVARLHYKGKPNRHLRGLRLSEPLPGGTELHLGERPVGRLGSSVLSPTHGAIGLALVRREAEPGATVSVGSDGASALVTELPFAPR